MVYEEELPQIRRAVLAVKARNTHMSTWNPKITLVVVGKRYHTRFFPKHARAARPGDKDQDVNLQAGLLIAHTVITAHQFTFYLQRHDSPQATAELAHYVVIINESEYSVDQLQEITHKLCFTGSRATTALSVCTPSRYADNLCDRLRCYIRPILDGLMTQNTLDVYRQNAATWRPTGYLQGRVNPWHERLDNSMFYL
ncbi:Piwi-domain-containing protein [Cadophora sp. DSE1049]|nr:Piwi-domain-containing protein [Cadophora sp. DSE1049]